MVWDRGLGASFNRLWGAAALTNLGDGIGLFVLPIIAVAITREAWKVALLTSMLTAAWPLFGLHAGLVVDRADRRRLLAAVNVVRAGSLVALAAVLAADAASVWALYGVALVLGVGETLADTSLTSLVPDAVGPRQYGRANARLETTINVAHQFAGPPLAGFLAAVAFGLAAGTAAAAYALAALVLLAGASRRPRSKRPPLTGTGELVAGLAYLWRHPLLRRLTLVTAAMNLTWAFWTALFVIFAIAPGPMGLDAAGYGLIMTTLAAGGVAGAVVVEPLRRRLGALPVLALDVVGSALLLGAPALSTSIPVIGAAMFAAGAGSAVWRVINASVRHTVTPDELLGRVYSASRLISWGVLPVGAAAGGALAHVVGVRPVFALGAAMNVVLLVALPAVLPPRLIRGAAGGEIGRDVAEASP